MNKIKKELKPAVSAQGAVKSIAFGVIFAYVLSILCIFIFSWILYATEISEDISDTAVLIITLFSTFAGGFLCGRKKKSKGLLFGAITGLLYFIVLFIVSAIIYSAAPSPMGISVLILGTISSALGGVIAINIKRKK